ncbi:hypothetical protein Q3G72_003329 [Acer saccharum]|nr:hypothetical protein Q3G72_003329 [Acer saccharum]
MEQKATDGETDAYVGLSSTWLPTKIQQHGLLLGGMVADVLKSAVRIGDGGEIGIEIGSGDFRGSFCGKERSDFRGEIKVEEDHQPTQQASKLTLRLLRMEKRL